jgi:glycosyltransferase involved in cell wall biosynthesis
MRIGFYAPLKPPDHPAPSGDRRIARLFMAALRGLGHDVTLLSELRAYNRDGDPQQEAATAATAEAEVARLLSAWQTRPDTRPDLLFTYHVYHKAADYLAPAIKTAIGLPYVIAEPSVAPKRKDGPWAAGYAQAGRAIAAADALLAITTLDRGCLGEFALPGRVIPFPPFLETGLFMTAAAQRDDHRRGLATRYGLPEDRPWLLAVGMMRSGDKLASFRRLAEILPLTADPPWHLLLVGDGPERLTVEAAFRPLRDRVAFLGQLEAGQLSTLYAASDLYVWPAINEAYGMAMLEAQAAGLPILSVRTRGVPDIVRHGETGWLAADDSPAVMAADLRRLLDDRPLLQRLALAAPRHVATNHAMSAAQMRLTAVFDRIGLTA